MIVHEPCGRHWPDTRHDSGVPVEHVCISAPGHAMECRCRCGALYPS